MQYLLNGRTLVWDFDESVSNAARLKDNNLFIEPIWNMRDTVGYVDTCVGVSILSEDSFYFVTFCGLGFTMQVCRDTVVCLKRQVTK